MFLGKSVRQFSVRWNRRAAGFFPWFGGRLSLELYNTLVLGVSFFFIFLSFNTTQNFETTLNANNGHISLGILYGCFALTNLFSGFIVRRIGNRLSMIIGGCSYVFYIATNIQEPLLLPLFFTASAVIGVGASLIWTSQGSCLSRQSAPETFGFFSGIFWAIFQANGIFGNLIAQLLIGSGDGSTEFLFSLFTFLAAVGVCCMFFLVYPPLPNQNARPSSNQSQHSPNHPDAPAENPLLSVPNDRQQHHADADSLYGHSLNRGDDESLALEDDGSDEPSEATWEETFALLTGTLRMFCWPQMAHLIPIMIFSGLSQSYFFGGFPPLLGRSWLGWGMMVLAFFDVVGSVGMGRLSDRMGRRLVLAIGALFTVAGTLLANFGNGGPLLFMLFLAAACFGIADACFNTQIYALIRHFCNTDDLAAMGFGFYRLIQAASSAAAFFYSIPLPFLGQSFMLVGFLVLGIIFLTYLHIFIEPIE